jgi:hypothetical protein
MALIGEPWPMKHKGVLIIMDYLAAKVQIILKISQKKRIEGKISDALLHSILPRAVCNFRL